MADVTGTAANDVLVGTNDDDRLNGLLGADKMAGGDGNDHYLVDQAGDVVTELNDKGSLDWIASAISTTLAANAEVLELVGGALNGTGNALNNSLIGNSFGNTLNGGDGHDLLAGGGGNDTLIGGNGHDYLDGGVANNLLQGGAGNDGYYVDSVDDQVIELAGQGIDRITSGISFDLSLNGVNVERLVLGGQNLTGIGNTLDNVIEGNSGDDLLEGRAGNDFLLGFQGKDTLLGGDGNDVLDGESGDDELSGD